MPNILMYKNMPTFFHAPNQVLSISILAKMCYLLQSVKCIVHTT